MAAVFLDGCARREAKTLSPTRELGDPVELWKVRSEGQQAAAVVDEILRRHGEGVPWGNPHPNPHPHPHPKPHPNPNLGPEQHALYAGIEDAAARWFAQHEEAKEAQAGVYAHINRKFTGYRNGKFREQLELRQTQQGSLYPQVERRG